MLIKWTDQSIDALIVDWNSVKVVSNEPEVFVDQGSSSTSLPASNDTKEKLIPLTVATPKLFFEIFLEYLRVSDNTPKNIKSEKIIALLNSKYFTSLTQELKFVMLYGLFPITTSSNDLIEKIQREDGFDPNKVFSTNHSATDYLIEFSADRILWHILTTPGLFNLEQTYVERVSDGYKFISEDSINKGASSNDIVEIQTIYQVIYNLKEFRAAITLNLNDHNQSSSSTTILEVEKEAEELEETNARFVSELEANLAISIPLTLLNDYFPSLKVTLNQTEFCVIFDASNNDSLFKSVLKIIIPPKLMNDIQKVNEVETIKPEDIFAKLTTEEKHILYIADLFDKESNKKLTNQHLNIFISKIIDFPKPIFKLFVGKLVQNIDSYNPNFSTHLFTKYSKSFYSELLLEVTNDSIETLYVLYKGANVNYSRPNNVTALHKAAEFGNILNAKCLLAFGANINVSNNSGQSPLMLAFLNRNHNIIDLIINNAEVTILEDNDNHTLLHYAARDGTLKIFKFLKDKYQLDIFALNNFNQTILHFAAGGVDNIDIIKFLIIESKLDINVNSDQNCTPLHYAAKYNTEEVVKFLIDQGAEFQAKTNGNSNVLHYAAYNKSLDVFKYLLENHNLDVNSFNLEYECPLHTALINNNKVVTKYLLENSKNIKIDYQVFYKSFKNIKDDGDLTCLIEYLVNEITPSQPIAQDYWNILLDYLIYECNYNPKILNCMDIAIKKGAILDQNGPDNQPLILRLAKYNPFNLNAVQLILNNTTTKISSEIFNLIISKIVKESIDPKFKITFINRLIEKCDDVNVSYKALLVALESSEYEVLKILIPITLITFTETQFNKLLEALLYNSQAFNNPNDTDNFNEIVSLLIEKSLNINLQYTVLDKAVTLVKRTPYKISTVRLLLNNPKISTSLDILTKVTYNIISNWDVLNLDDYEVFKEILDLLVLKGANVMTLNNRGKSILLKASEKHYKSEVSNLQILKLLIEKIPPGTSQALLNDAMGEFIFQYIYEDTSKIKEIIKLLTDKGADINGLNSAGKSLLIEVCDINIFYCSKTFKFLIKKLPAQTPETLLNDVMWKVIINNVNNRNITKVEEIINLLIAKGANITTPNSKGESLLSQIKKSNNLEMIEFLIEKIPGQPSQTLLNDVMSEVIKNNIPRDIIKVEKIINLLIAKGADITVLDSNGKFLLLKASKISNNFKILKFLIEKIPAQTSSTLLNHVMSEIIKNNVYVDASSYSNKAQEIIQLLIDKGANIYARVYSNNNNDLNGQSAIGLIRKKLGVNSNLYKDIITYNLQTHNSKALNFFSYLHINYGNYISAKNYFTSSKIYWMCGASIAWYGLSKFDYDRVVLLTIPLAIISIPMMCLSQIIYIFSNDKEVLNFRNFFCITTLLNLSLLICKNLEFNSSSKTLITSIEYAPKVISGLFIASSALYLLDPFIHRGLEAICSKYCNTTDLISRGPVEGTSGTQSSVEVSL